MAEFKIPAAETAPTSGNAVVPALATTIAVSVPVFLAGGLAVQIVNELGFSPAGANARRPATVRPGAAPRNGPPAPSS